MHALQLADELFLDGHDHYTGKPRIGDTALDTGLAGAVLGELTLMDRIYVDDDTVVTVRDQRPHGERVSDAALAEILKQQDLHPVRAWVEYLRDHSRTMVAPRLVHHGLIERVQTRQMLKQVVRYPATDPVRAASAEARLRYMLDHPGSAIDVQTGLLAGLVSAVGLDFVFSGATPREVRDGLTRMLRILRPDLRTLIVGVESAVAALALTARR
jgi:hypothetical protein